MVATILFILILSFLVVIHELGHFVAAQWAKVKVEEFGLGYPPRALKLFTYKGVPFTLNWIPFGGFVRMEGEDALPEERAQREKKNQSVAPFYARSATKRMIIILAGVFINFVFGIIAFSIVYLNVGIPTFLDTARIERVAPGSPAEAAGLPTNVNIIAIRDGDEIIVTDSNADVVTAISSRAGSTIVMVTSGICDQLECQELAQEFEVYIRTPEEIPDNEGAIGIAFSSQVFVQYPWYEQLFRGILVGVQQAIMFGYFVLLSLVELVQNIFKFGQVPAELAGPVGIVHQAQEQRVFDQGFLMALNFAGLLSVNLAIMNLLPIPALDGGRAAFILLEKIIGKHHIQKIEGYANMGGFVALVGLIVLVTARDVWRIIF